MRMTLSAAVKSASWKTRWLNGAMPLLIAGLMSAFSAPLRAQGDYERTLDAARQKAVEQVLIAIRSQDDFLRANAVEAAAYLPDRAQSLIHIGLADQSPVVRFAALTMVGKLRLRALAPASRQYIGDRNESVRAAAMFALQRCGERVDLTPLAGLLMSPQPSTRANVAMLMGMMEDPSAVPLLKDMAKQPLRGVSTQRMALVRLQMAEAVVKLGGHETLSAIQASAFAQHEEVQVLAVLVLGRLKDHTMAPAIAAMLRQPPVELQLAAAEALARLNDFRGLDVAIQGATATLPTVRSQAAATLAQFRDPSAAAALVNLLNDPTGQVRVAAAAAVLGRGR